MKHGILALSIASLLTSTQAFGWADLGHGIVGEIAEQNLSPRARDYIRGVLGIEALSVAAVWPDHARDDQRFGHQDANPDARDEDIHDFGNFHFCEIPTGYTYSNRPNKDVKDCHGAIANAVTLLKNPLSKTPREAKMIALRYLVHVVGDIHQPLHVGNGYDRGGNSCLIRWKNPEKGMPLHSFWDETLVQYLGSTYADPNAIPPRRAAGYVGDFVKNMRRVRPEMFTAAEKARYAAGGLNAWLQESQTLRESGIYPDNADAMKNVPKGKEPMNRPYCAWFTDQNRGTLGPNSPDTKKMSLDVMPLLDEASYANKYAKVVESQLLKGGLRLAAILDDVAATAQGSQPTISDSVEESILKMVQDSFRNRPSPMAPKPK